MQDKIFKYNKDAALLNNSKRLFIDIVIIFTVGCAAIFFLKDFHYLVLTIILLLIAAWAWSSLDRFKNRKRVITTTCLQLLDNSLIIKDDSGKKSDLAIKYKDLKIGKVKRDLDGIKKISLIYGRVPTITLEDFNGMNEIHSLLTSNISE